jgi:hypothetical protein
MGSDPVFIDPKPQSFTEPKEKEKHREGEFKRQHVLFEEIRSRQVQCGHTITQPNKETLTCTTCGALWLK